MVDYTELPQLKGIYLEDSYVLKIDEAPGGFAFTIEAVLTPENPAYHDPRPGEQYCYVDGALTFSDVTKVEWDRRSDTQSTDADGEVDFGNIDSLVIDNGVFLVEGDWGKVRIHSMAKPISSSVEWLPK